MYRLALVLLLVVSLGCASSGSSIGRTEHFYANTTQLFVDAENAIVQLGGTIITSNQAMGVVVGRFDVEGTPVDLDVGIKGPPSPDASGRAAHFDVTARASLVGDREPDQDWTRQLEWLTDEYMNILSSNSRPTGTRAP